MPFPGVAWPPGPGHWKDALRVLHGLGLEHAAVVRLKDESDLAVVRALVPGLETWHATGGASRLGPILRSRLARFRESPKPSQ